MTTKPSTGEPKNGLRGTRPGLRSRRSLAKFLGMCLLLLTAFSFKSEASHYRYGNISYTYGTNDTVIFHISQSYRKSYAGFSNVVLGGTVTTENFNFGDAAIVPIVLTVTSVNTTDDIFFGEATIKHHYATTGNFTAFYASSARLSTLVNNADGNYRSQCIVQIGPAHNSSPAATVPPIVNVPDAQTLTSFSIPATEPDGQTYRYRFATATEMGGTTLTQPTVLGITIDSITGLVKLNTTPASVTVGQLYNAAFVVTDASGATTMVDFIIKIVQPSTPPSFNYALTPANNFVYDIQPGQTVAFQVSATDIDPGDHATLSGSGIPPGATVSPSLPAVGNPTVTVSFSWTPTAAQLGSRIVSFTAQDVNGNQTTTNITIITSMNPQFDAPPTLAAGSFNCLDAGSPFSTTIQAHAPDAAVTVSITSATTLAGMTYSPAIPSTSGNTTSTVLNWTPTASQWGVHTLAFVATDNLGHTRNHSYDVVVNTTPTITSAIPPTTIYQNQPFTYNLTVTDPDLPYGDIIDIDGIGLPAWLTLTQTGPTTATLSGTPTAANLGANPVQIDVEDSFHHCHVPVSQLFTLNVQSCAASFTATGTVNVNASPGICGASNVTYSAVATLSAAITYTYTFSGATSGSGNGTGSGSTFAVGTTAVDVSATTPCGTVHDLFNVNVTDNQAPVLTIPTSPTVNSQDPVTTAALGTATATDNCGTPSINYNDVSTKDANPANIGYYNYTITRTWTATDIHGLTTTGNQIISVHDITAPVVTAPASIAVCDNGMGNSRTLTATATDAASSPLTYSYVITGATGGSGNSATLTSNFNVGVSTITWTVTDVAGNINNTSTTTVTIYSVPVVSIASTTNIACFGQSNGAITTTITGGTPGFNYLWTPGNVTTPNRSGIPAGTYAVAVSDLHGCTGSTSAMLTQPAVLSTGTITGGYAVPSCTAYNVYYGYGNQTITLAAAPTGGTSPYAYNWTPTTGVTSTHAVSTSVTPTATATYTQTITDSHGCTSAATYQVKVLDVRCGPTYVGRERNNTVTMCHQGASACVSPTIAATYITNGECLGACATGSRGVAGTPEEGTDNNLTGLISVYPNPAHAVVNIQLSGIGSYYKAYQVVDLTGKLIAQQAAEEGISAELITINVADYAHGIYLVRVVGRDNTTAIARFTVD